MNHRSDELFDPRIAEWLEDGPDMAPSLVLDTLAGALPVIPQRQSWRLTWRSPLMLTLKFAGLAAAAALILIVAVIGVGLFSRNQPSVGGPGASPSPAATALATAAPPTQAAITPAPPTPNPSVTATPPTPAPSQTTTAVISAAQIGRALQAGSYRINDFAAPFAVTLPAGWTVNELTPNSVALASRSDGSVNIYMAVIDKVYPDPCHTAGGPSAIGGGVDDLVTALSSMPGFDLADLADATVGGASGKSFTISNSIDVAAASCSGDTLLLGTFQKDGVGTDLPMFGGESDRFWVVDANGTRVLVAITDVTRIVQGTQPVFDSIAFGD